MGGEGKGCTLGVGNVNHIISISKIYIKIHLFEVDFSDIFWQITDFYLLSNSRIEHGTNFRPVFAGGARFWQIS